MFSNSKSPFFIIGVPRSGTTLLAVLLNNHPLIYVGKQAVGAAFTRVYQNYLELFGLDGDVRSHTTPKRLLNAFKSEDRIYRMSKTRFDNYESGDLKTLLTQACEDEAKKYGKLIWGDKTPNLYKSIPNLSFFFPHARFIHVIRDGRAVAVSHRDRQYTNLKLAMQSWKLGIITARFSGEMLGSRQYKEVIYEELLENPEHVLSEICDFLEVDFSNKMFDLNRSETATASNSYVGKHIDKNRAEKWRNKVSPKELYGIEQIAGDLLQHLGYKLEKYSSDGPFKALTPFKVVFLNLGVGLKGLFRSKQVSMVDQKLVQIERPVKTRFLGVLATIAQNFLSNKLISQFKKGKVLID